MITFGELLEAATVQQAKRNHHFPSLSFLYADVAVKSTPPSHGLVPTFASSVHSLLSGTAYMCLNWATSGSHSVARSDSFPAFFAGRLSKAKGSTVIGRGREPAKTKSGESESSSEETEMDVSEGKGEGEPGTGRRGGLETHDA